jgi:hypothetical protein
MAIAVNNLGSTGSRYLKIKQFYVPSAAVPSMRQESAVGCTFNPAASHIATTGVDKMVTKIGQFYSSLAIANNFNSIETGTIIMDFDPTITHGYMWVECDGEELFVGEVRHEVSRARAVTILSVLANGNIDGYSLSKTALDISPEKQALEYDKKQDIAVETSSKKSAEISATSNIKIERTAMKNAEKAELFSIDTKQCEDIPDWVFNLANWDKR